MSSADLLRLLVVPVFGWIAYRDYETRRVPTRAWYPILAVGVLALGLDAYVSYGDSWAFRVFGTRVLFSVGLLVPMAYLFYRIGAFGRADAKALATLAICFPIYPAFDLGGSEFPLVASNVGVFSLTIITNGVLLGAVYPVGIALWNVVHGRLTPAALVGKPVDTDALLGMHGKLLEDAAGFTVAGLDLDALRMYLRWRGLSLSALRENSSTFRRPSTLPAEPNDPTDGAVDPEADPEPGGAPPASFGGDTDEDPWGAAAFLASIDGSAYGTDPETLRAGLDCLAERERVWVSPGLPFLVPLFVGLLVALSYGDVMFGILRAIGLV